MGRIQIRKRFQNIAVQQKGAYVTRKVQYSTIRWQELVEHVQKDSGLGKGVCFAAMQAIVKQIEEMVENGHSVNILGLGHIRLGINCKSSDTREGLKASNIYRVKLLFRPTEALKREVNNVTLDLIEDNLENSIAGQLAEEDEEGNIIAQDTEADEEEAPVVDD